MRLCHCILCHFLTPYLCYFLTPPNTSVIPVKDCWAKFLGDPTIADSILDRVTHNAYRIEIRGKSMRSQVQYGAIEKRR